MVQGRTAGGGLGTLVHPPSGHSGDGTFPDIPEPQKGQFAK